MQEDSFLWVGDELHPNLFKSIGYINLMKTYKIPLYQREFKCINCGFELDRDYNSAINIKKIGKELTFKEIPIPDTFSIK